jgi:hypothetical protein
VRGAELFFIVALLLLATGLRFAGITFGQPDPRYMPSDAPAQRLPLETPIHPDEYFYVSIPFEMAVTKYPNPKYYESPSFIIDVDFIIYLLTGSGNTINRADWEGRNQRQFAPFPAYVIGRVVSALGGIITVAAAYAAARRMGGRFAAAGAGLLTAVSFTLVQHSHYATPSIIAAAWSIICVWASLAALQQRRPLWWLFALAGVAAGFAATTRYNAAGVSIVVFLSGLILLYRFSSRRTLGIVMLGWLLFPASFVLGTPGFIFDPAKFNEDFSRIVNQFLTNGYGFSANYLTNPWLSLWFHLRYLALFSLGIPAVIAIVIGIYGAWRSRPPRRNFLHSNSTWLFALILLIYLLVYTLVVLRNLRPSYNDHMLIPVIPLWALLAGLGVDWLYRRVPLPKPLLAPALMVALVTVTLVPAVQYDHLVTQPDTRYIAQRWVYDHIPLGSNIHLSAPYNVPLDPADYTWTQTFIDDFTPVDELRAQGAEYVILSDAWLFDVTRSREFMSPDFIRQVRDYYASYDQFATPIAHIERPLWTGYDWLMHTASYWHDPALTVYCLTPAACAAVK